MTTPPLPENIGPFKIISSLGQGGMGEVFLAFDPTCQREVALKRVRTDLSTHEIIKNRFLREALITSKLAHPAIVPIYSIHEEDGTLYYIMPYLKGDTLKNMIRTGEGSISSFLRIFMMICQAVAYAHSKGYLHRDLKPENIIVGKYGQVHILDWGLVKALNDTSEDDHVDIQVEEGLTRPGKLVGTLAYLAPERILKHPSSISSDIYALGVTFYQLLTFRYPFKRKSIKEFRLNLLKEKLISPEIAVPYRDVPPELSRIVKKCLSPRPSERYLSVDALIKDLENYLEGRSDWFLEKELDIFKKDDWEFQENVLIPSPIVSGREKEAEWVSLMVSKDLYSGNTQLKARVKINDKGAGIGFLLSIPEKEERMHPTEGYCLWVSAEAKEPTKLFRSNVQVLQFPDMILPRNEWCTLSFEKIENNIYCRIDGKEIFSYISHLPLTGTHVGILYRDTSFELEELSVYVGSLNLQVSCLAIPDAFLDHKDYSKALLEYRRIANSFPGRQEAREGIFRSGITLLEEAEANHDPETMNFALEEFEKLRNTPGAPLEYLGKALVYKAMKDPEEEIKCFELGIRRYPKHPLLPLLEKEVLYRLHSRADRATLYRIILLILTSMPSLVHERETHKLLIEAQKNLEQLFFIEEAPNAEMKHFAIQIAFLLDKPGTLAEIFDILQPEHLNLKKNALFCLIKQEAHELVEARLPEIDTNAFELLKVAAYAYKKPIEISIQECLALYCQDNSFDFFRVLYFLLEKALSENKTDLVIQTHKNIKFGNLLLDSYALWAFLLNKDIANAQKILQHYSPDLLNQETTPLHFLYGCFLYLTEGKDVAQTHFSSILDTPFPKSTSLASHYLFGKGLEPSNWLSNALPFEKQELYKQLALFYHCQGNPTLALHYQKLLTE